MKKNAITLLGVGDILIDREKPETIFRHLAEILRSADIAYGNCEQALSDKGIPNPIQAAHHDSRNLNAFLSAGFDVVSLANNHSLDWGREALLDTMERLNAAGLAYVGIGRNLIEARKPAILERKGNRVGFLAYSCVHLPGYEAGDHKPGLVPIRVWTIYDQVDYQPGTPPRIVSIPYKEDLAAMVEDIKQLRTQVDVVVLCMHWGLHIVPRVIPMYCFEIGHTAIDAGADLILGTHPHVLKGIEMYRGRPIFYSTANFALELGPHMRDHEHVQELDDIYGITDHAEWINSMIVKAIIEGGQIKRVSYIPCHINTKSEPEILNQGDPRGQEVFGYVADASRSEGLNVHFSWEGDEVLITS